MAELYCKFKTEYARYSGEEFDTIEGVVVLEDKSTARIKGPVPPSGSGGQQSGLPNNRFVYLFGDWKQSRHGREFRFHSILHDESLLPVVHECQALLAGRSFRHTIPIQHTKKFRDKASFVLNRNPYVLMEYPSASFERCDQLWLDLGRNPDAIKRQSLMMTDLLDNNNNGHVWLQKRGIQHQLAERFSKPAFSRALRLALRANLVSVQNRGTFGNPDIWVANKELADCEKRVAEWISRRQELPPGWPSGVSRWLYDDQRDAMDRATSSGVGLLVGGGGTGKTYCIAQALCAIGDLRKCVLCAPTGKAAVRMAQSASEAFEIIKQGDGEGPSIPKGRIEATTIHRMLFQMMFRSREDKSFREQTITRRYFFIDESSMLDIKLIDALLQSIPHDACVMFVGDHGQLPPIGPGAPFRDLQSLESCGTITKTRRNGGLILRSAQKIRKGEEFETCDKLDTRCLTEEVDDNLVYVPCGKDRIQETVADLVRGIATEFYDGRVREAINHIQVMGVVNRRTPASVTRLNKALRSICNDAKDNGYPMKMYDKLINTENGWMIPNRTFNHGPDVMRNAAGQIYVANGEQGVVVKDEGWRLTVELNDPKRQVWVFQKKLHESSEEGVTGTPWRHGYAITGHKSQGSQWPFAVCVLDGSGAASRVMDRSMIYTLITRAAKACYLVGDIDVAYRCLDYAKIDSRQTYLYEQIQKLNRPKNVAVSI